MLPNEVPVVISGTTHYYTLQSLVDSRSVRRDTSEGTLALPRTLTVARTTSGKGNKAIDSYLIRLDSTIASEQDANSYVQSTSTLSAYMVVKVPSGLANGRTQAYNLCQGLRTLLAAAIEGSTIAVASRWLNGEL